MPKLEDIPPCPVVPIESPGRTISREYEIQLITPMVGGGANAGTGDFEFPIRPTAIRGHLRHWWRLIRGHSFGEKMWQREEEIFGSTEFPSPVTILVESLTKPEQFDPTDRNLVDPFGPVAYALFASIENNHLIVREGVRFRLSVHIASDSELLRRRTAQNEQRRKARKPVLAQSVPPIATDIEESLRTWMSFGGLGGRTRRGCGAIKSQCNIDAVPQVPARILIGPAQQTPIDAWKETLSVYREFRQTPRGKVHPKTIQTRQGPKVIRVPGRSHWPEADSVRKITGCSLKPSQGKSSGCVPLGEDMHDHSTPVVPRNLLPAFPKAVLGLPINFHFVDGPKKENAAANLDPKDVQLYPLLPAANGRMEKAERMASPIITRPIWRDGKWHPAIIILDQKLPDGFRVRVEGRNAALSGNFSQDFPSSSVVDCSMGVLNPMRGKGSAIDALIDFLDSRKFTEFSQ